ncbi:MAG: hypothetical protein ACYTAF_12635, partial [Planctomycetota bacterium]
IFTALGAFVMGCITQGTVAGGVLAAVPFLIFGQFVYVLGAFFSMRRPTLRQAFGLTMLLVLVILVVVPVVMGILAALSSFAYGRGTADMVQAVVSVTNPFAFIQLIADDHISAREMGKLTGFFIGNAALYGTLMALLVVGMFRRLRAETPRL